jgi:hypothetical protein
MLTLFPTLEKKKEKGRIKKEKSYTHSNGRSKKSMHSCNKKPRCLREKAYCRQIKEGESRL